MSKLFEQTTIKNQGSGNRWRSGDMRKAFCVSDNGCFRPAFKGEGMRCVVEEKQKG